MQFLSIIFSDIHSITMHYVSETGGILGKQKDVVTHFKFDKGLISTDKSCYIPDTEHLNYIISEWQKQNIEFCGIYHTHFDESETLSNADKQYIKVIMKSMPDEIDSLYFPLVFPKQQKIVAFKAIRQNNTIDIIKEDVEII